ncbi:MAG: hypothetical protein AABZ44_03910, partial [Elusimicrobiota bacterium]
IALAVGAGALLAPAIAQAAPAIANQPASNGMLGAIATALGIALPAVMLTKKAKKGSKQPPVKGDEPGNTN